MRHKSKKPVEEKRPPVANERSGQLSRPEQPGFQESERRPFNTPVERP